MIVGASFAACLLVVLTQHWHGKHSLDHDLNGAQKLHTKPVPRVGGVGLIVGLLMAGLASYATHGNSYPTTLTLLVCALPVFMAGLVEDLTKRVSVRTRLLSSFVSAALAVWLLHAQLVDVDTPVLDTLMQLPLVATLFTVFAVGGVTHSVNIIDGLNGLAGGAVCIMLAGLAALAWIYGDAVVMKLCLWGIAGLLGFMLLNYPFGKIFLGDGGLPGRFLAGRMRRALAGSQPRGLYLDRAVVLPVPGAGNRLLHVPPPRHPQGAQRPARHGAHAPTALQVAQAQGPCPIHWPHWLSHGVTSVKIWVIVAAVSVGGHHHPHTALTCERHRHHRGVLCGSAPRPVG
jgi:hypothetical protein